MTKDLDQLRQVAANATTGPWAVYDRGIGYEVHDANGYELNGGMRETFTEADATYIATFDPSTVLALINRVQAAEAAVQRVREVHKPARDPFGTSCAVCIGDSRRNPYPCPTIRALDGGEQE